MKDKSFNNKYIIALIVFAGVCVLRFFDRSLNFHSMPMGIMQDYRFCELITVIFFICFFVMTSVLMHTADKSHRRLLSYLIMFAAAFMYPMYLNENYFGASDVYAWIICMMCICLIIIDRLIFLIPIAALVMTVISPMSVISVALLMAIILVLRFLDNNRRMYLISSIATVVLMIGGMAINIALGIFSMDIYSTLSPTKFIVSCVLFIPYIIIGILFTIKLLSNSRSRGLLYIVIMFPGVISPIFYLWHADYSRALFYAFSYYIILVTVEICKGNKYFIKSMADVISVVNNYVSFPGVLIAYPFVIMTMWVSGPVTLFVETFVGL